MSKVVIRTGVWAGMTEEEVAEFFNFGRDLDSPKCDGEFTGYTKMGTYNTEGEKVRTTIPADPETFKELGREIEEQNG